MENLLCPGEYPSFLILSNDVPQILYYALIPGMVIALFLGFFILLKNKKAIESKIFLLVSILFFIWGFFSLVLFAVVKSNIVMVFWSLTILVEPLIYAASLYLTYVFTEKEDISFPKKIIIFMFLLPLFIFVPTRINLIGVDISMCDAIEGPLALYFSYFIELLFSFWIIILAVYKYRLTKDSIEKKRIAFFAIGISIFLLAFASGNIIGSFTSDWVSSQYGYFGMPVFLGFLAYTIVKYRAFNIKLIGAQVLVIALVILVGSQFFFIQTDTNRILTGITLTLVGGFGIFLIRSIKAEAQRKEELQLMSDKLAESNDKLRKLDNAKSEFISIASHQLRTPLTAIKGFISLLNEGTYGNLDPKQAEVLKKVYISNERLIALVEDLLNISRIESGRMEFKFDSCQLTDLCQELVDTFTFKAKDADLYLDFKAPENVLPEVFIDRAKVREVLSNLIDNAIKYTPRGGVSVRLERVFAQDSKIENIGEKGSVKVIVADTGIGVPAEEIPYLFSKFSRGKDVSRLNVGGTGLGLYVGRSMMEANGGKIWIESDGANKGSRFIIEVPVEQTPENLTRWS